MQFIGYYCRYQLQNGADPNTVFTGTDCSMRSQWSALHICCQKGQYYCAKQLVEAGMYVSLIVSPVISLT